MAASISGEGLDKVVARDLPLVSGTGSADKGAQHSIKRLPLGEWLEARDDPNSANATGSVETLRRSFDRTITSIATPGPGRIIRLDPPAERHHAGRAQTPI